MSESQANEKILFEDHALYRVENEVVLHSDLKEIYKNIRLLGCLLPHSPLLNFFEWDEATLENISVIKERDFSTPKEKLFFNSMITLKKLSLFIGRQQFFKAESYLLKYRKSKCRKKHKDINEAEIGQLMVVDSYVEERFFRKNTLFEKVELDKLRKRYPQKSRNVLKKMFLKEDHERRSESLQLFIKSLNRKISHQPFI